MKIRGDETESNWFGPYNSGETLKLNHTWQKPEFKFVLNVKVKDQLEETPWILIKISTPRNTIAQFTFFEKLLQRFQILKYILRNILN